MKIMWCTVPEIWSMWQTEFFVILDQLFPFYPLTTRKTKILKKWKKSIWRYDHFTHVYHKWQSYEVWFPYLRKPGTTQNQPKWAETSQNNPKPTKTTTKKIAKWSEIIQHFETGEIWNFLLIFIFQISSPNA